MQGSNNPRERIQETEGYTHAMNAEFQLHTMNLFLCEISKSLENMNVLLDKIDGKLATIQHGLLG
jgi:hypothetical protein